MSDLETAVVREARDRIVTGFPAQVRACLDALGDDEIWSRPNASSNSVGNLVLHLCGSTRHFLGRGAGGSDFVRDRPGEFSEKGPIPKADLLRRLDETVAEADRVLSGLAGRLLQTTDRVGGPFSLLALVLRTTHHWAVHTGQIVYATKAMKPAAFEELWQRTMK